MRLSNEAVATIYELIDRMQEGEREDTTRDMINGQRSAPSYRSELYYRSARLKEDLLRYEQESIKEKS